MTAHQFALRKLGADGPSTCDIDPGCDDFGCKRISDVYGVAATGALYGPAGMEMHDSKKATVRA
jgi:hypothetical protein